MVHDQLHAVEARVARGCAQGGRETAGVDANVDAALVGNGVAGQLGHADAVGFEADDDLAVRSCSTVPCRTTSGTPRATATTTRSFSGYSIPLATIAAVTTITSTRWGCAAIYAAAVTAIGGGTS